MRYYGGQGAAVLVQTDLTQFWRQAVQCWAVMQVLRSRIKGFRLTCPEHAILHVKVG